jgi:L-erythro-3,5-diaminohexanoate dehydrogenase
MGEELGADRVLAPSRALPQPAERLDASGPVRPREFEVAVDRLCLDATSFANVRAHGDGDPERMAARILEIVSTRGKMHNPDTDSGGVALGNVTAVGADLQGGPTPGERIVTLASLTLTPLHLDEVTGLDPDSAQVGVRGTAYLPESAPWGPMPDDIPANTALEIYDVYAAASHTRELVADLPDHATVCVLGIGHAGRLVLAAARDADAGAGRKLVAVDRDAGAVASVVEAGLCDTGIVADLRDPLGTLDALGAAGVVEADLTVVVVSATGCESAAILATARYGTLLFYSMATSFQTAALTADGMSRDLRMLIGHGYAADRGAYALDLYRRSEPYRAAIAGAQGSAAA